MKNRITFLALSSFFGILLLGYRIVESDSLKYIFLAWNLVLAWIPLAAALLLREYAPATRFRWPHLMLLAGWLLFLPNAPYLITDLLHLKPRAPIPFWFDGSLTVIFAWNGLMAGLLSARIVHDFLGYMLGTLRSTLMIIAAFALSGFGVYLGRVERWNSWDLITDPLSLLSDVAHLLTHPFSNPGMLGMSSLFFLFLTLAYFSTWYPHKKTHYEKDSA